MTAFAFWLDYVDSQGGLWERSGDAVLAVLPERLAAVHELPESALVTDDPDISREDGVLFLGAGHPEISRAAESVLGNGDVGVLTVPHRGQPLSTEDLLARIRELVAVDHGRIDATGAPIRTHRPTVRLAALVTHTVSAEDQFTEVAECLVDVPTRIDWPEDVATTLRQAMASAPAAEVTPGRRPSADVLTPALTAAHQVLDASATARGRLLAAGAAAERDAELTRAREYYAAALATIDKRRGDADPRRTALLDTRVEATTAERDRRLAEIAEKYRHQHALRPYRLHLVDIPVWRLDTDVRRGDRRWPVTFDYLPLTGTLAPTRCPNCAACAPLVATKTGLRCTTCVPPKPEPPAAAVSPKDSRREPSRPRTIPPAAKKPAPAVPPSAKKPAPAVPLPAKKPAPAGPVLPGKAEERKVADFWQLVADGDRRKLARLIAPDTPLAALTRVYGPAGPAFGIGVPAGETPSRFTCRNYDEPVAGQRGGTAGTLHTGRGQYQYLLLWSQDRLLDEILPYSMPWHLGTLTRFRSRSVTEAPTPHGKLDKVAALLLTRTTRRHGLTFAARALAAWWRLPDPDDLLAQFPPPVLAATVERAVRYWSRAAQVTYPEVAEAFGADQAAIRGATPVLQKRLRLSETVNW